MTRERIATLYIAAVASAGAAALAVGSMSIAPTLSDPLMVLLLAGLAGVAQRLPVFLFRSSAISVAFAATIATYVLYGTGVALWVNLVSAGVNAFTPRRKPLAKVLFNAGSLTVSAFLASTTYQLVGGRVPPGEIIGTLLAVAISGLVYFGVSTTLLTSVIALTSGAPFREIYRENYSWMVVNWTATAVNGAALALAYQSLQVFGALAFVMPLGVSWYSFKLYMVKSRELRRRNDELESLNRVLETNNVRLEESHRQIIDSLVGALEAKDSYTRGHSAATAAHAVALARQLGLTETEIQDVQLGALFHDIGKIGIPERILTKAGPLTPEEREQMQGHTRIGASLLGNMPSLQEIRPIVEAHHERYDGTGYPDRLKGEAIPLAARIIAVADSFHAMISPRAYRAAMTRQAAIAELRRCSGTQLDPALVDAFIGVVEAPVTRPAPARPEAVYEHAVVVKHIN